MDHTTAPALQTRNLTVRFGGHVAVDSVSYDFRPGCLVAIVGPNGAGKTTYFNLISGQLRASSGTVIHQGDDITRLSVPERTRRGIGRAFQLTNLFRDFRFSKTSGLPFRPDTREPWTFFGSPMRTNSQSTPP